MDLQEIPLFAAMRRRLAWLGERQTVLARNVANADTPGYRPQDLKPPRFEAALAREGAPLPVATTESGHLQGTRRAGSFARAAEQKPFETSPAGNAVVLEEQMAKVHETATAHHLANQLYRKHLKMLGLAVSGQP